MEVSRVPPRTEAAERLENYIRVNHLPVNSRIPSERDLCEMWHMNRTTLRYAVDTLVDDGKLYRKKGSGTFIAEPKLARNMLGVDELSSSLRREGLPLTTKILSFRVLECTKQLSRKLHLPLGHKIYESLRLRSISGQPCIIETTYIPQNLCPDFERFDLEKSSMYSIFKNIYKMDIVDGEENISVTYTTEEEGTLLGLPAGEPIFYASGVTYLADGAPLEYYKALFRADRFRFVSTFKKVME